MSPATSSWMDAKRVEAIEKVVLQRAKISRITRQLKNRLALASYKTKRGWENLDLDAIEPRVAEEAARRRSSSVSGQIIAGTAYALSSPIKQSSVSASLPPPALLGASLPKLGPPSSSLPGRKQGASNRSAAARKRARTLSHDHKTAVTNFTPWKSGAQDDEDEDHDMIHRFPDSSAHYGSAALRLSQSSPVYPGIASSNMTRYPSSFDHNHHILQPSLPPPPPPPPLQQLPNGSPAKLRHGRTHSQNGNLKQQRRKRSSVASQASTMSAVSSASTTSMGGSTLPHQSSPPRTPPRRTFSIADNDGKAGSNGNLAQGFPRTGEEGADLLMFLATSPSPAQRSSFVTTPLHHNQSSVLNSSTLLATPPSNQRHSGGIPFGTPLLNGSTSAAPHTPSQGFNFSDYVNNIFTPSPAQVPWHNRTPTITPARRRLSFDQLPASENSPTSVAAGGSGTTSGPSNRYSVMEVGGSLLP
ncbi:uncharacterized protein V1513DRAFT_447747 [Lipomyces chichibuensis]|uniref:uncharacterized protein n=1 Tax=Lipomyces chichibuensis TaxID=1546026 RepID=UPI003343B540